MTLNVTLFLFSYMLARALQCVHHFWVLSLTSSICDSFCFHDLFGRAYYWHRALQSYHRNRHVWTYLTFWSGSRKTPRMEEIIQQKMQTRNSKHLAGGMLRSITTLVRGFKTRRNAQVTDMVCTITSLFPGRLSFTHPGAIVGQVRRTRSPPSSRLACQSQLGRIVMLHKCFRGVLTGRLRLFANSEGGGT